MHLRRLELQGFKTFAARTEFLFHPGITAIVGPNGSGKSNVVDALRWALGEQSARALRTRKVEEVIFAGSSLRSPLGMAEATLTLDNGDGWLDGDLAEVGITRRLYRSGESEYLINRTSVRLRDLYDLLVRARVGQNPYTVVGQGMVDGVLNLRPEERRGLLEEAADVRRHYRRVEETREKLAATLGNRARAEDLQAELVPRLEKLALQAQQVREQARLHAELQEMLVAWYAQQWERVRVGLSTVTARLAREEEEAGRIEREAIRAGESRQEKHDRLAAARAVLDQMQEERRELEAELAAREQTCALERQQAEALARQKSGLDVDLRWLEGELQRVASEASAAQEAIAALTEERRRGEEQIQGLQASIEEAQGARKGDSARLQVWQTEAATAAARVADLAGRLDQVEQRLAEVAASRQEETERGQDRDRTLQERRQAIAALGGEVENLRQAEAGLAASARDARSGLEATRSEIRRREGEIGRQEEERRQLATRLELLSRLDVRQAGLYPGVRAVLEAASDRAAAGARLEGIIGPVSSLVRVPSQLETAIEVALGGRLQDVVVQRWEHAEAAIEMLKRSGRGRATFLPLDTLRPAARATCARRPGVLGIAVELVEFEPAYQRVMDQILGRTVVVSDLVTARALLAEGRTSEQIVTLAGEVVRPHGAVTGGSLRNPVEGGVLARERERRELPTRLVQIKQRVEMARAGLATERIGEQQRLASLSAIEKRLAELAASRGRVEGTLGQRQRELERLEQAREWQEDLARRSAADEQALQQRKDDLAEQLAVARGMSREREAALADLRCRTVDTEGRLASQQEALAEGRRALARAEAGLRVQTEALARHRETIRRQDQQREGKRAALAALLAEETERQQSLAAATGLLAETRQRRQELSLRLESALREWQRAEEAEKTAADEAEAARLAWSRAQQSRAASQSECERRQLELAHLQQRMETDGIMLDQVVLATASAASMASLSPTPLHPPSNGGKMGSPSLLAGRGEVGSLAQPASPSPTRLDAEALRRRIDRLRVQLRTLGPINPAAVAEYEEAAQRQQFLVEQLSDLKEAEHSLRSGIAELEALIRRQFSATFGALNTEFGRFFTTLFAGGRANLTLSQPESLGESGVDIMAQPPGKRPQSLALLSGGERSLTGVALLFALLAVNPSPFCVLDEVDAALDETNVTRFGQTLRSLTDRTQFIVITHNRATVESADTIYGVTAGPEGVSRVLSLRLPA